MYIFFLHGKAAGRYLDSCGRYCGRYILSDLNPLYVYHYFGERFGVPKKLINYAISFKILVCLCVFYIPVTHFFLLQNTFLPWSTPLTKYAFVRNKCILTIDKNYNCIFNVIHRVRVDVVSKDITNSMKAQIS